MVKKSKKNSRLPVSLDGDDKLLLLELRHYFEKKDGKIYPMSAILRKCLQYVAKKVGIDGKEKS